MVFLGGGVGSICRYGIGKWINRASIPTFPYSTLLVNLLACLAIGMLAGSQAQKDLFSPAIKYLFIIGFCGGFSTFSAFSIESMKLWQDGNLTAFFIYILISIIGCILLTFVGFFVAQKFFQ